MRAPPWLRSGRVPTLDGLRGLSVLAVIVFHWASRTGVTVTPDLLDWVTGGRRGVDVFYVISGFLITLLLFREQGRTGGISLRGFYHRRILRLVPAQTVFVATVCVLVLADAIQLPVIDLVRAATYTVNIYPASEYPPWPTGHLWSLSLEEHFYLLWPATLAALGRRRAFYALTAVLVLTPAVRYVFLLTHGPKAAYFFTPARLDAIGWGCLLAYAAWWPRGWPAFDWLSRWGGPTAVGILAATVGGRYLLEYAGLSATVAFGHSIEGAGIAAVLGCLVAASASTAGRVLEARPLVAVGVLSYSLYLWHMLFCVMQPVARPAEAAAEMVVFVIVAVGSYFLIERPFLRLKDGVGVGRSRSPGNDDDTPSPQCDDRRRIAAGV